MGKEIIMAKQKYTIHVPLSAAEADKDIVEAVQKKGIQYPNTNLAFFKAHYGKIETPNGNRIRMGKEAVEKALPGLIGVQCNKNHMGEGFINGYIVDAWINEANEIDIIIAFFKSIYEEDYLTALELIKKNNLNVSFELLSERGSQEFLSDGTIRLNDIEFTGVGLLFGVTQAYKNGKVFEMASLYKQRAESSKELVYASQVIESCEKVLANSDYPMEVSTVPDMTCTCPHCNYAMDPEDLLFDADYNMYHKPCVTMGKFRKPWFMKAEDIKNVPHVLNVSKTQNEDNNQNNQGERIMTDEQKKEVEKILAELAGYIPQDVKDEDLLDEAKVAEYRLSKTNAETTAAQEAADKKAVEDKAIEDAKVADEAKAAEAKAAQEKVDAEKAKDERIVALESKVKELEATVESQKTEIEAFKAKDEAAKAQAKADQIAKIKAELKDNPFCKEFTDEDYLDEKKVKDAQILKENADLKAENEALKKGDKTVVTAAKKDIDTGHQEEIKDEENPRNLLKKVRK
jgi:hypothetical protein